MLFSLTWWTLKNTYHRLWTFRSYHSQAELNTTSTLFSHLLTGYQFTDWTVNRIGIPKSFTRRLNDMSTVEYSPSMNTEQWKAPTYFTPPVLLHSQSSLCQWSKASNPRCGGGRGGGTQQNRFRCSCGPRHPAHPRTGCVCVSHCSHGRPKFPGHWLDWVQNKLNRRGKRGGGLPHSIDPLQIRQLL
jgi:hypothetical protein